MRSPCDTAGPRPARQRGRSDPGRAWRGHGARRVSQEVGGRWRAPQAMRDAHEMRARLGCGRNPPGCRRRDPAGVREEGPAGSDGYGLGEGPAGTQDVVRAPVTVAQVLSLGQRPRHRHLQRGHVNTRHPPTHTHTHYRGPAGISTGNGKLRDHTRLARVYGDEAFTMPLLNLRQQLKHPY